MPLRECAKKDGSFTAVSLSPDLCKTPPNDAPIPYQITASLDEALSVSPDVKYNGVPVVLVDESRIAEVVGDEAGSSGGVQSGVNQGEVRFAEGSRSFKVNSLLTVRDKDKVTMNKGNVDGRVHGMAGAAPVGGVDPKGRPQKSANPPAAKPKRKGVPKAEANQAWLDGKTVVWQHEGIPPLTALEKNGSMPRYDRWGNPMGIDVPPLQPKAGQDVVMLVSRPVTGGLGLLVSHSAVVIQVEGKEFIIQSGPEGVSNLNIATMNETVREQGLMQFRREGAVSTTEAKWFVTTGKYNREYLELIINEWNTRKIKYFEPNKSIPATTCNTFSKWFLRRIGLKLPTDMPSPSLYGWGLALE